MTDHADFSRLPSDALGFFGLSESFQRDDLRRAYGRLIRKYKPDSAPTEFQKIRAAYEQLDAQLRYGDQTSLATAENWQSAAARGTTSAAVSPTRPGPAPIVERLRTERPETIYKDLSRKTDKTGYDFYALAVLSDTVESNDPLLFLKWLLTGLTQDSREPALLMLLREYLRSEVETAKLPSLLLAVSKVVTHDRFYFVTEPAWDRLLRESAFAVFRQSLAAAEANLHDYQISAKLAFYVHLLLAAVWKGDADWTAAAFAFVEEHAKDFDRQSDFELELASLARSVASLAGDFLNGNTVRKAMIDGLRAYCTAMPVQGMQTLIRSHVAIASDALETMAAFPPGDPRDWSDILRLWHMVTSLVVDEVGLEPITSDPNRLERSTFALINNLREELMPVVVQYNKFRRNVLGAWFAALVILPPLAIWGWVPLAAVIFVVAFFGLASVAAYRIYAEEKWFGPWFEKQLIRRLESAYAKAWRPRVFRHQYAVRGTSETILRQLYQSACETGDDNWIGWIINMLLTDAGFAVFSQAQQFLR